MRAGFGPEVLFPYFFCWKRGSVLLCFVPGEVICTCAACRQPCQIAGRSVHGAKRALLISYLAIPFLAHFSFLPSLWCAYSAHLKGGLCSIWEQFSTAADAHSPARAKSRARQRSQSTAFASNARWQVISHGFQQKMGFSPSSSPPQDCH